MPLVLNFLQEDDIAEFAAVDAAAMANWGVAKAMQNSMPEGVSRQQMVEDWTRKDFGNDSELVWLKVTDTDLNNEMVAAAMWGFHLKEEKQADREIAAPAAEVGGEEGVKEVLKQDEAKKESKPNVMTAMQELGKPFKKAFVGGKPHASLHILVTHPKHQRRGAGSMLIRWGCEKADERGLTAILMASEAGFPVYLKNGFELVWEKQMDLRPYGVEETELRRGMVRQAKPKAS